MKSLASEDKVAQELPSYPSGAVTRGQPGEKAVTGRQGIRKLYQKHKADDFDIKAVRLRAPGQIKKE